MSDTTLDRILEQCSSFILNPDSSYMLNIFQKKLSEYGKLSVPEQNALLLAHQNLMKTEVIPAWIIMLRKIRLTFCNDLLCTHHLVVP